MYSQRSRWQCDRDGLSVRPHRHLCPQFHRADHRRHDQERRLASTVTLASGATYRPFDPLTSLTYGNTLALTKTFNADHNLTALTVMDGGTSIVSRSYAYGYGDFDIMESPMR